MRRIVALVASLFRRERGRGTPGNAEALRTAFKQRYHHFRLLLRANNRALELMTEMDEALTQGRTFAMSFVLSRCTSVCANVWQIVTHLDALAPGRYRGLIDRFRSIQDEIGFHLQPSVAARDGPLAIPLEQVDGSMADLVGRKTSILGEIAGRLGIEIPRGFVVTSVGYQRFMEHNDLDAEIRQRVQAIEGERPDSLYRLSSDIQQRIMRAPVPEDLLAAIFDQYARLEARAGSNVKLAVRSSSLAEDASEASFAGQYRTELNVSRDSLLDAFRGVVAGKYRLPAMTYRRDRGLIDEGIAMCVAFMAMVEARAGGVVYSRDPTVPGGELAVVSAVVGLPKLVVDGSATPDVFRVSRGKPMAVVDREIPLKESKLVCHPREGVSRLALAEDEGRRASLDDESAVELARIAVRLEEYFGTPQDIEWALEPDGSPVILQCRPLRQIAIETSPAAHNRREYNDHPVILSGGSPASPGAAAGAVYRVDRDLDAFRFEDGSVLVASQALPRWSTLLSRSAAVVTEHGSIAGHLASVARELGVPALFGVQGAMDLLDQGATVTVDADGIRVLEGEVKELVRDRGMSGRPLSDTPVHAALRGALQHIVPLNLLDPDSPGFTIGNCETLHDITRFCHEKSVHEMFQFGKRHRFPERSSKQLVCDMPMQGWIQNLDDGFHEEVEGTRVKLENIASRPMLAIWEGIAFRPWEGPPSLDTKGFLSVMFQATTNTALVPGAPQRYGDKNYFMISKNYCSLSSRLGFHFSIVEALVSERTSENYASFQFKGGAADWERRLKRVAFIGRLLEESGFRVQLREDSLIARIEDHQSAHMLARLRVLGYVTIHTRQLDMIMLNEASVGHYGARLRQDIRTLLAAN